MLISFLIKIMDFIILLLKKKIIIIIYIKYLIHAYIDIYTNKLYIII